LRQLLGAFSLAGLGATGRKSATLETGTMLLADATCLAGCCAFVCAVVCGIDALVEAMDSSMALSHERAAPLQNSATSERTVRGNLRDVMLFSCLKETDTGIVRRSWGPVKMYFRDDQFAVEWFCNKPPS
jgi:hypothetical protein